MDTQIPDVPMVAIIYRILAGDKYYIGSTTEGLQCRMQLHYIDGKVKTERKLYKAVAEAGGWVNVKVSILESFAFTTKKDTFIREDAYIKLDDPNCMNTNRAFVAEDEVVEHIKEAKRRCYEKIKQDPEKMQKRRERMKMYRAEKSKDPEYLEKRREQQKAYMSKIREDPEKHKLKLQKMKEYRERKELGSSDAESK